MLSNSLTKQVEEFVPIDENHIRMYACGPTVYDRPHLGNARAAVVYDVLYRLLKSVYPKVTYVRNITDVDDKIITAANEKKEPISALTKRMEKYYHADLKALNCLSPDIEPRATENIDEMITIIESLLAKDYAYVAENHVLFSVNNFKHYGRLSNRSVEEMIAGSRVEVAPFKKNPCDFVLWKPRKENESDDSCFESPWGRGRPGWHIECSAMSHRFLGKTFDIHGGGADLIFPHHENEIAQTCCFTDESIMAKYWVHNGFLTVEGEKMSKSLGNFKTVREELESGIEGAVIRYLYLSTHYKKPLDYTEKALDDALKAIEKFRLAARFLEYMTSAPEKFPLEALSNKVEEPKDKDIEILEALANDLNTPKALALLHLHATVGLKGDKTSLEKLKFGCEFLGIDLTEKAQSIPNSIIELAEKRVEAKKNKDWKAADALRDELHKHGFQIKDTTNGYEIKKIISADKHQNHD